MARRRVRVRGLEGLLPRTALRLHRHDLRPAARRKRHPVAVYRRRARTAPSGSTPTGTSTPIPTTARRSARTSRPARARRGVYRAKEPHGRAFLHAAEYEPSPESPTTSTRCCSPPGRTLYHFHTRTKTGRAPQLQAAAPDVWVEMSPTTRESRHREGDLSRVESRRGEVQGRPASRTSGGRRLRPVPLRRPGTAEDRDGPRAANELTATSWDPVSKQPQFKVAAVTSVAAGHGPAPAPTIGVAAVGSVDRSRDAGRHSRRRTRPPR